MQSTVLFVVPLKLIAHKLWLTLPCQTIIMVENPLKVLLILLAIDRGKPLCLISVYILIGKCRQVPCHVKELLHLHLHRLDVTHIQKPVTVSTRIIRLLQFLVHQHRCCSGNPYIVMGYTQITQMVINARTTLTLTLSLVRHSLHITKVIVRPHQRDILWHLKPCIIDVKCFLVWHKNLWNLSGRLLLVCFQNLTLVCHHLFQCTSPHLRVSRTFHCLIVQTAHTHRVDVVILRRFPNTVVQLLPDGFLVCQVIPLAIPFFAPFGRSRIVEKQWFTVTGRNHDAPLCRLHLTLRMTIESTCTSMHSRSQHVGF